MNDKQHANNGDNLTIKERLETVVFRDLYAKLGVSSELEISQKFAKLSQWVARPVTQSATFTS